MFTLAVRNGKTQGDFFETDTGAPQGDCLSAIQFTYYLAKTLEKLQKSEVPENDIDVDLQYADDISEVTTNETVFNETKAKLPEILTNRKLKVNVSKTEEYVIQRGGDTSWKNCKFLGTKLDANAELSRRKGLAIEAINSKKEYFNSPKLTVEQKSRIFESYVSSIFLYNCELWTINECDEVSIDAFQRRLLKRYVLNIKWPRKIRMEDIYKKTKQKPWSRIIAFRRLGWFGHLARLPDDTPAKRVLNFVISRPTKLPVGKPKTTWLSIVRKQIKQDLWIPSVLTAIKKAQNRELWRKLVKRKCAM